MPVMDGFDAAERIRASENTSQKVPILCVTATAEQAEKDRAIAVGMDVVLSKPLSLKKLSGALGAADLNRPEGAKDPPLANNAERAA